jgi:hypothetical protein
MPSHGAGPETQQNRVRFKNLLAESRRQLKDVHHIAGAELEDFVRPAAELLDSQAFWHHQLAGLAVFIATGDFRYYRLPVSFDELVVVRNQFYIKPLLRLFTRDARFYILAVAQRAPRLYESTPHFIDALGLKDVPDDIRDVVGREHEEPHLQWHSGAPPAGGRRAAQFHGHGGGKNDSIPELRRYFALVDRAVNAATHGREAPLVLAGLEHLLAVYRDVSTYPHLVDEEVRQNPAAVTPAELRQRGWSVVEPIFARDRLGAGKLFRERLAGGQAADDLRDIVPATAEGRVEVLFIAQGVREWGTYDAQARAVVFSGPSSPDAIELLDYAAARTLMARGTVYSVPPEDVPAEGRSAAAIFRY